MVEFAIGRRVKVVAPDPNDITDSRYVGRVGTISCRWRDNKYGYKWGITFDDYGEMPFAESELSLDGNEELITTYTLEGTLEVGHNGWDNQQYIIVGDKSLWSEMYPHKGKRVRLTWEVVDDE
jgi:hypothetical protein